MFRMDLVGDHYMKVLTKRSILHEIELHVPCCRICILAGDISPIDVITHIPVLCEENQIPYIYVPSKEVRP